MKVHMNTTNAGRLRKLSLHIVSCSSCTAEEVVPIRDWRGAHKAITKLGWRERSISSGRAWFCPKESNSGWFSLDG